MYLAINAALLLALGKSLAGYGWYLAYLGNVAIGMNQGAGIGATGHLWSLAVEQQFYLVWPFVVLYVRRLWIAAAIAFLIAPVSREILIDHANSYFAITSLPSCMDMLATGALVACVRDRRLYAAMLVSGAVLLAYCATQIGFLDLARTQIWAPKAHLLYTAIALLTAPLIATAHDIRFLKNAALEWIGKISYSMYIWQLIVILFLERAGLTWPLFVATGVVVTTAISWASWRFVEQPFLRLKSCHPWEGR